MVYKGCLLLKMLGILLKVYVTSTNFATMISPALQGIPTKIYFL